MWVAIIITASIFIPMLAIYLLLEISRNREDRLHSEVETIEVKKIKVQNSLGFRYPVDHHVPRDMVEMLDELDKE